MEPIKILSLDDLDAGPVTVTVRLPDGRTGEIALRVLPESEVFALRQGVEWPAPPVSDVRKRAGSIVEVHNFQDKGYQKAMAAANRDLAYKLLLRMLPFAWETADEAERLALLQAKMGQGGFLQLVEAANLLNSIGEEEIAAVARSFRRNGRRGSAGHAGAGAGAEPVAGAAPSGADGDAGI